VNERRTVVGVDWPLDWPSISLHGGGDTRVSPNRGERSTRMLRRLDRCAPDTKFVNTTFESGDDCHHHFFKVEFSILFILVTTMF